MIDKLYYLLTAYVPRTLPKTQEDFEKMREIMVQHYGLEDDPKITYTLASQLMSGEPHSLRRSYGSMANAAKKLNIAKMVQDLKSLAIKEEQAKLKEKAEALKDGAIGVQKEPYDIQTDVQVMPEPQEHVVSES